MLNLSLWQRFQLWIQGYAFVRYEKRDGWTDFLPVFVVKCKKHGLFEDYRHGYSGYFLCPKCLAEESLPHE